MQITNVQELGADSLLSDELFEELYEIEDSIDRQRKVFELQDRAKVLGIKSKFDALYHQYEKLVKNGIHQNELTIEFELSEGVLTPYRSGCWNMENGEIFAYSMFGKKVACSHPIVPIQILTNAETGFCKVRLMYQLKGKWKTASFDKDVLASSNKIVELAKHGIRVTSESSRALVQYLSDMEALNEDRITEEVSTSRLGWINGEFMPYGADVIFDDESNLRTLFESVKPMGDRNKWYELALEQRQVGKLDVNINMIASFASPLVEIVNGLPFVVSLWGDSGRGKTVALMLATSVWADPSEGKYMSDAKATSTALELRLNFLNSLPMMLDDMAQVKNQYEGNFSDLIYRWCAGKGKDRANRNLGLNRSTTWKNCILTNAEHSLIISTMQSGAVNRIIDIEMAEGEMFKDGHAVVEVIKSNYGHAGKEYIGVLKELGASEIRRIQKKWYDEILSKTKGTENEKEEKQILPMSILLTADEIIEKYLFKDGYHLNFDTCVKLLKNKNEVSENERTYQYLVDEIVRNGSKFVHITAADKSEDRVIQEQWGIVDEVKHQAIIIRTTFNEILRRGGFSDRTFLSWAARKGIIETDMDGIHKDKIKRINGTRVRCVFLDTERDADEFVSIDSEDASDLPF